MCGLPRRFRLIAVAMLLTACGAAAAAGPKLLRQCPGGKLYQVGGQKLLLLAGTPYRMGYAHGTLLKDDVKAVSGNVLTFVRAADGARKEDYFAGSIEKAYRRLAKFIPARYQEEMRGLADASGVPLDDVRLSNVFPALFHCSGFAVFGRATRGGQLLHGRVLDYLTQLGLQDRAVTIVARGEGRKAFVNVSYAGFIGSVTGMNADQVAIGELGGGGEGQWDGMPMPMLIRKALEEAATLDQAVDIFRKTPRTCEYYYVISDGKLPDARGLYCTPKTCEVLKPGQKHAKLPDAVQDAVLFSAGERLTELVRRVRAAFGKLDPPGARRLMTPPVTMKENLHDVLMAPSSLELWVAHAATDLSLAKYQACHQPYQHYKLAELLRLMPAAATKPPAAAAATSQPAQPPARQAGRVPITVHRPLAPAETDAMRALLKPYDVAPAGFRWRSRRYYSTSTFTAHAVAFPSPLVSPHECNNTVYGEYFRARAGGRRPGVIVLHILDGKFLVARVVCNRLATAGIHALLVKMPYYGPRRPKDDPKMRKMTDDPEALVGGVRQAVLDVRRAARWLSTRPEVDPSRVGICGVSLGGFVAATSAGIDGHFPRVAVVLAGGDLLKVLTGPSKDVAPIREALEKKGWSTPRLKALLAPIDPLTYASRLRRSEVLMISARNDKVVPAACAQALAEATGARIKWYPADHYSIVMFLPTALKRVVKHFSPDEWEMKMEYQATGPKPDAEGILHWTVKGPYQREATEVEVLLPKKFDKRRRYRVLYILPVNAGTKGPWGSGIREAKRLGLHDKHDLICVAPSFDQWPWYADHPTDALNRQESHLLKVVLPLVERNYPVVARPEGRLLVGFSKSGWGAFSLLLRHPATFGRAAAWDAPLAKDKPNSYGMDKIFATQANFEPYRIWSLLVKRAEMLRRPPARLILLGYGNFRDHHERTHAKMQQLGIPHTYDNSTQRKHDWRSGWLAGAVEMLVAQPDTP